METKLLSPYIIFDAMGVIFVVGDDTNELLVPFIQKYNNEISQELINKLYIETSLGKISSRDFWTKLGFVKEYPDIEKEYLDTQLTLDPNFKSIAERLVTKYQLGIISNDVSEWSSYLRQKFGLNEIFDEVIISGDVGLRKPNLKIFKLLLQRIEAKPEEVLFVDDSLHNVKAASELGINTLRFVREKEKVPFCSEFEIRNFSELWNVLKTFF